MGELGAVLHGPAAGSGAANPRGGLSQPAEKHAEAADLRVYSRSVLAPRGGGHRLVQSTGPVQVPSGSSVPWQRGRMGSVSITVPLQTPPTTAPMHSLAR